MERIQYWDSQWLNWSSHSGFGDAKEKMIGAIQSKIHTFLDQSPAGGRILDIGAGANNRVYFGDASQVYHLDLSRGMLSANLAKKRIQADAEAFLPISSDSFFACTSFFLLRYLSDHINFLSEVKRVLRPGGKFLLIDVPQNNNPHQQSNFDYSLVARQAQQLGFSDVTGEDLPITVTKLFNTGFGADIMTATFHCGLVMGNV